MSHVLSLGRKWLVVVLYDTRRHGILFLGLGSCESVYLGHLQRLHQNNKLMVLQHSTPPPCASEAAGRQRARKSKQHAHECARMVWY